MGNASNCFDSELTETISSEKILQEYFTQSGNSRAKKFLDETRREKYFAENFGVFHTLLAKVFLFPKICNNGIVLKTAYLKVRFFK